MHYLRCLFHPSLISSLLVLYSCGAGPDTIPERTDFSMIKNVVVLVGDDHAAYASGAYGNALIRTPRLDGLAGQGVFFTRAYANAPLCSASRQSLLTGRYPHAAGVTLLRTSFPEAQVTLAEHLSDQGYRTGVFGKTHFNNAGSHGFDTLVGRRHWHAHLDENPPRPVPEGQAYYGEWRPFRDPARVWLNAEALPLPYFDEDMEDTFYADAASEFIREADPRPFLCWIGFHNPHSPFNFPEEYRDAYAPENMPVPEGSPEDDRWIPEVFRDLNMEEKQGIAAAYYTSVEHLDSNVGRVLDALEASGRADSTLVIYLGDQGYLLGHHKRFEKHMMWEEAIRAPLIMRFGSAKLRGGEVRALCEFVDLTPTVLELLGLPPLPSAQGKSLLPVLSGRQARHKPLVFSEFLADNKAMVRTDRWKYIYTTGKRDLGQGYATGFPPPGVTHRLYDLLNDPEEKTDLAGQPAYRDTLLSLQDRMLELFHQTHPLADSIRHLSPDAQLAAYCEPPDNNADLQAR